MFSSILFGASKSADSCIRDLLSFESLRESPEDAHSYILHVSALGYLTTTNNKANKKKSKARGQECETLQMYECNTAPWQELLVGQLGKQCRSRWRCMGFPGRGATPHRP